MERDHHNSPNEISRPLNFRDVVLVQQEKWRKAKKNPLTQRSQAVDFPEPLSKRIFGSIIDCLPDFVPDYLRQELLRTHPSPIYATALTTDARLLNNEVGTRSTQYYPDIEEKDRESWHRGVILLNEAITDGLSKNVVQNLGQRHKWFFPQVKLYQATEHITGTNSRILKRIEQVFDGKKKFEEVKRGMVLTMLSGDYTYVDEQMGRFNTDIDEVAVTLGNGGETIRNGRADMIKQKISLGTEMGANWLNYPGIIELGSFGNIVVPITLLGTGINGIRVGMEFASQNSSMGAAAYAFVMSGIIGGAGLALSSMPNTIVHETCHYLSYDINHSGFIDTSFVL